MAIKSPHKIYVDVFGGGAHVLCAKPPSLLEIYNDIDSNLVNFFEIIRTRQREFIKAFKYLMYSEKLYNQWKKEPLPDDPLERAVKWFFLQRASCSGKWLSGFGHSHQFSNNHARSFRSALLLIPSLAHRFSKVEIHNHDFREEILQCDSPDTLF
jgi:DNA adenine methylase